MLCQTDCLLNSAVAVKSLRVSLKGGWRIAIPKIEAERQERVERRGRENERERGAAYSR